jgi:uncharacterized protein YbbC (DUF1343 family)
VLAGCAGAEEQPSEEKLSAALQTGAQTLAASEFDVLNGRRVGLIVNHTARVDTAHLIDRIHRAPNVELGALFGPEHGLRGTADAGEKVADGVDDRTGAPIYSLYGANRQPTAAQLEELDALVFDIQDVGARFYTYISTMGLAMQAAAENDMPFIVLDRPNPLGGEYVSGFVREPEQESFVGQYPIPIAHGMTVGELARMIQGEAMLPGLDALDLRIVELDGWDRMTRWLATDHEWIPPSPNLPTFETALVYAGACFFEATSASAGRGTQRPFLQLGAPWPESTSQALVDTLNAQGLPGVTFNRASFTPQSIPNMASSPRLEGTPLHGVRYRVTDVDTFQPVEAGVHVLHAFYQQAEAQGDTLIARPEWLARLAGTPRLQTMLEDGASPAAIIQAWTDEVDAFRTRRQPYLLY